MLGAQVKLLRDGRASFLFALLTFATTVPGAQPPLLCSGSAFYDIAWLLLASAVLDALSFSLCGSGAAWVQREVCVRMCVRGGEGGRLKGQKGLL